MKNDKKGKYDNYFVMEHLDTEEFMKNDKKGKYDNYFVMEHLDTEEFMKNDDDNFIMEHLDYDDDFIDPRITSVGSWLPGMLTVLFWVSVVLAFLGYGVWWIAAEYSRI